MATSKKKSYWKKDKEGEVKPDVLSFASEQEISRHVVAGDQAEDTNKMLVYRTTAHLQNQINYNRMVPTEGLQLNAFIDVETLMNDAVQTPLGDSVVVEGIRLDPAESKMVKAISRLLHKKSDNVTDTNDPKTFYAGNALTYTDSLTGAVKGNVVSYGAIGDQSQTAVSPILKIKPSDLYYEYTGKKDYSGTDAANVRKILARLLDKKFFVNYKTKTITGKTDKKTGNTPIETAVRQLHRQLIKIEDQTVVMRGYQTSGGKEVYLDATNHTITLILHPIFRDQIEDFFVLIPYDLDRYIEQATGTKKTSDSTTCLINILLEEISLKRTTVKYFVEDTLIPKLKLDKAYFIQKRKKEVRESIIEAIEITKAMGLLKSAKFYAGGKGKEVVIFTPNLSFMKSAPTRK